MPRIHPHAEATYRVVAQPDDAFGVEVTLPDSYPTMITRFATAATAEAWIAKHKREVDEYPSLPPRRFKLR